MKYLKNKIAKILYISSELTKEQFYKKHNINEDEMQWLGSGDFGNAYYIGNNKVLKITNSKKEYDLAKKIMPKNKELSGFVDYYDAEKINNEYMIIMEMLKTDPKIENDFYELENILSKQSLPIVYIDQYLDTDELDLDNNMLNFINNIEDIVRSYKKLGVLAADIHPDNLGYDKNHKIKAFDIFEKG